MGEGQFFGLLIIVIGSIYMGTRKYTNFLQWVLITVIACLFLSAVSKDRTLESIVIGFSLFAIIYLKNRKKRWFSGIRMKFPQRRKTVYYNNDAHRHAQKGIGETLQSLDEVDKEIQQETYRELQKSKSDVSSLSRELEELKAENERLREEQTEQRRVEEATPRLRHYHNLARKKLDEETSDLSKLKEKRLREELQRQRDENRDLKKNQRK